MYLYLNFTLQAYSQVQERWFSRKQHFWKQKCERVDRVYSEQEQTRVMKRNLAIDTAHSTVVEVRLYVHVICPVFEHLCTCV